MKIQLSQRLLGGADENHEKYKRWWAVIRTILEMEAF